MLVFKLVELKLVPVSAGGHQFRADVEGTRVSVLHDDEFFLEAHVTGSAAWFVEWTFLEEFPFYLCVYAHIFLFPKETCQRCCLPAVSVALVTTVCVESFFEVVS